MKRRGFTLVEAMTSLVVLVLIGGAIMAFYAAGARFFARTSLFSQASDAATRAAKQIALDAQEGMAVKYAQSLPVGERSSDSQLVIALPAKDASTGYNLVPLREGTWFRYYLADKEGVYGSQGTYLWRASKPASSGSWRPERRLAESVSSVTFDYVPNLQQASRVVVSVTVTARRGGRSAEATQTTQVLLRNVKE